MEQLTYTEFLEQRLEYDAAVAATPDVCDFCSSSSWLSAAHEGLHEYSPDRNHHIFREGDSWLVLVERNPHHWYPLESAWMFASPLIGPDPSKSLDLLFQVAAEKTEPNGYVLGGIRKGSVLHEQLRQSAARLMRVEEFPATDCMAIDFSNGWESYLENRPRKFRKNLRAAVRKCEEAGVEIEALVDPDPDILFERILALQKTTHKWKSGTDIFQSEDCFRFYRVLIREMAAASQLRVNFAKVEGKDAAFIFGSRFHNTYRGLQMSFDDQHRDLGLGNYLQFDNMKRVAEEGVQLYDLGMHSEYKERWADQQREFVGMFLVM